MNKNCKICKNVEWKDEINLRRDRIIKKYFKCVKNDNILYLKNLSCSIAKGCDNYISKNKIISNKIDCLNCKNNSCYTKHLDYFYCFAKDVLISKKDIKPSKNCDFFIIQKEEE